MNDRQLHEWSEKSPAAFIDELRQVVPQFASTNGHIQFRLIKLIKLPHPWDKTSLAHCCDSFYNS